MIYELVLRNFDCSLEFVFSLLLLQPFTRKLCLQFSGLRCVILREIDFLLKICWSTPCLHPSWKVHTWIEICASLNHRKKTTADGSRLIPRKHTETLALLSDPNLIFYLPPCFAWSSCFSDPLPWHSERFLMHHPHLFSKHVRNIASDLFLPDFPQFLLIAASASIHQCSFCPFVSRGAPHSLSTYKHLAWFM